MKRILFLFVFGALLSSCNKDDKPSTSALPVMSFTELSYDFGTIHQGDVVNHVFHFANTGATDLIISNAVGSCGCTIPEYTHEPIPAGATGEINVSFNSAGKSGRQTKSVTITANTARGIEKITITASITAG